MSAQAPDVLEGAPAMAASSRRRGRRRRRGRSRRRRGAAAPAQGAAGAEQALAVVGVARPPGRSAAPSPTVRLDPARPGGRRRARPAARPRRRSRSSWWSMKGRPATSTRAFGSAPRSAAAGAWPGRRPGWRRARRRRPSLDHDLRSLEVEAEADLLQPRLPSSRGAAASCPRRRTSGSRRRRRRSACRRARRSPWRGRTTRRSSALRHAAAALASCAPSARSSARAKRAQVARLQRLLALVAEVLDEVEVLDHLVVAAAWLLSSCSLRMLEADAAVAGEEQQQVVLEVVERLGVDLQRPGLDAVRRAGTGSR